MPTPTAFAGSEPLGRRAAVHPLRTDEQTVMLPDASRVSVSSACGGGRRAARGPGFGLGVKVQRWPPVRNVQGVATSAAISFAAFAAVAIHASRLSMTATAGAFASNATSPAHTRTAFAQNATCGTTGAVIEWFALVQFAAPGFSHRVATLSIAHGLAYYGRAALLSLRKKVREAPAPRRAAQTVVCFEEPAAGLQSSHCYNRSIIFA
jgi:hypothetical protein